MKQDNSSVSLIYSVVKDTLAYQQGQKTSLETKASALTAFAGGMFALLMGARETLLLVEKTSQILILISVALFAVSVILANIVTWIRKYRADPDPEALAQNYLEVPLQEIQLQIISNMIGTWKTNKTLIERNAIYLRFGFLLQAIAFILLGSALFLSIL
jgi:hypothetical protein